MLRSLLAGAMVFASPVPSQQPMDWVQYPGIVRVDCTEGKGTAVQVGENHYLSVAHVTALNNCAVNGFPIHVTEQAGSLDFSQFDALGGRHLKLKISCEGFKAGQWYWATGFAHGAPFQTGIALYATYAKAEDGKRILIGPYNVIPGQSGGAIFDRDGAVVGMVNAYMPGSPISLSRELKDTSLCR